MVGMVIGLISLLVMAFMGMLAFFMVTHLNKKVEELTKKLNNLQIQWIDYRIERHLKSQEGDNE